MAQQIEYNRDVQQLFLEMMLNDAESYARVQNIFNPYTNNKLKGISSYKLLDLQKKCKDLQIGILKIVNGKEKKKTKKDEHTQDHLH